MKKPTIYLAGPIAGCNEEQLLLWRRDLIRGFSEEFDFIDPTDNLIGSDRSDYDVVHADAEAIRSADAVLANMWRESIGTAIGVVHAHTVGKIVVVCDPNFLQSRTLAFYADSVERSLPQALAAIRTFVRAERLIQAVRKSGEKEEPFDRQKLALSVRKACIGARQSDLVPARAIVFKAMANLLGQSLDERVITTEEIRLAVWEAIAELASDPVHEADYDAIRRSWEGHPATPKMASEAEFVPQVHERPLEIAIRSSGTHSTIWGNKVDPDAARIFNEIAKVEGIVGILLTQFTNTGSPPSKPHVRLTASTTPGIIEGKCYAKGKKGTLQTFQIRVANVDHRDSILAVLRTHLEAQGHIRSVVFSN